MGTHRPWHRSLCLRPGTLVLAALLLLPGCAWFRGRSGIVPPAPRLYEEAERQLARERYAEAREALEQLVERHPESELVPLARLLIGESYYREREYGRAAREFEAFMTLYPGHPVADLAQYRLARSYYDQMPTLERDQAVTARALTEFEKLLRQYPESRYAPDAIVKMEACRLRLAQKELWVADYYRRQGKLEAALARYDVVLRDYARTAAVPQALYEKAEVLLRLGRPDEAAALLRRLLTEHPATEWARRARQEHARLL